VWFIEGDISDCFGSLSHDILLGILAEKIHDQRFLRLIRNMLKAGYLEDWEYHDTLSGCPQGGVVSPILSNIYLDKLDKFIEQELIPQHTRGDSRAINSAYRSIAIRLQNARRRGDRAAARDLKRQLRSFPSKDPMDPGYRRLRYCRYADDQILGFIGPKAEAEEIKAKLATFLRETLGLELNSGKTLITHARSQPARFLGYDVIVQHCDTKLTNGVRSANGRIALRVPPDVVKAQCARYRMHGKPWHRPRLQNLPDYDIVRIYGAEYRGVVNYYLLAQDVGRLTTLRWYAVTSMLKTLGAKHKSTVTKMANRHQAKIITRDGTRTCFEARLTREGKPDLVARFGGISLRQDRRAVIRDPAPAPVLAPRKELIHRLRRRWCELCEIGATVAVHQIAGLKEPGKAGAGQPAWAALMAKMRRKTLIVCVSCHEHIHANPVARAA
jgi:Reverse transcriptase (RNA-dependent DNA polymerase)/Type II intron maturase